MKRMEEKALHNAGVKSNTQSGWAPRPIYMFMGWPVSDFIVEEDAETILAIPVHEDMEDLWAWHYDPKGLFTNKSAYKLSVSWVITPKVLWNRAYPPWVPCVWIWYLFLQADCYEPIFETGPKTGSYQSAIRTNIKFKRRGLKNRHRMPTVLIGMLKMEATFFWSTN